MLKYLYVALFQVNDSLQSDPPLFPAFPTRGLIRLFTFEMAEIAEAPFCRDGVHLCRNRLKYKTPCALDLIHNDVNTYYK